MTLDDFYAVFNGDLSGASSILYQAAKLEGIEICSGNGSMNSEHFNMAYGLKSRGCTCGWRPHDYRINISNRRGSVMLSRWSSDSPFANKIGESVPLTPAAAHASIRWLAGIENMQQRRGPYG